MLWRPTVPVGSGSLLGFRLDSAWLSFARILVLLDFGLISAGFGLASAGFGLDFALSLIFTRIFASSSLSHRLSIAPEDSVKPPRDFLWVSYACMIL